MTIPEEFEGRDSVDVGEDTDVERGAIVSFGGGVRWRWQPVVAGAVLGAGVLGGAGLAESVKPVGPNLLRGAQTTAGGLVELTWNDRSGNEVDFQIQRKTGNGSFQNRATRPANSESYSEQITPGSLQGYRVRARNADGTSAFSNTCFVNGDPARPSKLTGKRTAGGIQLQWKDNSATERKFQVQRRLPPSTKWSVIANLNPDTTGHVDATADEDTVYAYRVRAMGDANLCLENSSFSNAVTVQLACPTTGPIQDLQNDCEGVTYVYQRNFDQATLVTDGSRVEVNAQLPELGLWVSDVQLLGDATSAKKATFDTGCGSIFVPDEGAVFACISLPIGSNLQVISPPGAAGPIPNPTPLRGEVFGELVNNGSTLRLRIESESETADFSFADVQ
jgi:hypothetical protein